MKLPDDYEALVENPRLPEDINAPKVSVFRELWLLSAGVVAGFILLAIVVWQSLGWLAQFVPLSWEARLVQPLAESVQVNSTQQQQLQQRVDELLTILEAPEIRVQVHLLSRQEVNAFATLGGQLVVTQGLLDVLDTQIGLDFVLLHELAHLLNRDPIRAAASQLGARLLLGLITAQGELPAPTVWLQSTEQLLSLHYSRVQEYRADAQAFEGLRSLYGSVDGFDEVFVTLQVRNGSEALPEIFLTHPHTQSRIERLYRQSVDSGAQ